jgi:hypothetical protein
MEKQVGSFGVFITLQIVTGKRREWVERVSEIGRRKVDEEFC